MRIFQNKDTNQIIIVTGKQAYSIFGYADDRPFDIAKQLTDSSSQYSLLTRPCEEIDLPTMEETKEPTTHTYIPEPKKQPTETHIRKDILCEPSQQNKKIESSTNSTPTSPTLSDMSVTPKIRPKLPPNGNEPEMSQ